MKTVRILTIIFYIGLIQGLFGCKIHSSLDGKYTSKAPIAVSNIDDGLFSKLTDKTPQISWDVSEDSDGSIDHYLVAIGTSKGSDDILKWTAVYSNQTPGLSNLSLSHGNTYYISIIAVDDNGDRSPTSTSDGWTVDTVAPSNVPSFDDGSIMDSLGASPLFNWNSASDSGSGISHYEISLGNSSGGTDVMDWTKMSNETEAQITGLNLVATQTYYPQIRAVDLAGNLGVPSLGDGWSASKLESLPSTNGTVKKTLTVGNTLYIGGSFSHVGPMVSNIAQLNNDGSLDSGTSWPEFNDDINIMVPDGAGGYYVGGEFTEVAGQPRLGFAHLNSDGSLSDFTISIGGSQSYYRQVKTLLVVGDTLYIGGCFETVNDVPRRSFAAVTISTKTLSSLDPDPHGNYYSATSLGVINALHMVGTNLYLGGDFITLGGESHTYLASLDTTTGNVNSAFNPVISRYFGGADVFVIKDYNGDIYFGGDISYVNGVVRNAAAAVDATTGVLNTAWIPVTSPTSAIVSSIVMDGINAYIGGDFWSVNGCSFCNNVAHVDLVNGDSTAQASGWLLDFYFASFGIPTRPVLDMALIGTTLYVAHENANLMTGIPEGTTCKVGSDYFAAIDITTGIPLSFHTGVDNEIRNIEIIGTDILISGAFKTAGGALRPGMAAFDLTTGNLLPFDPFICDNAANNVWVSTFEYDSGYIYLGGRFDYIRDTARSNIARVDAITGSLDASWSADSPNDVYKIQKNGSKLYVSGKFNTIDAQARNKVARFDLPSGSLDTWDPDITAGGSDVIRHLVFDSGNVYLFGEIDGAGGNPRMHAAAVLESDGSALSWDPQIDDGYRVWDAFIKDGKMYISGHFGSIQGQPRSGFAVVDLATATLDPLDLGALGSIVYKSTLWNGNFVILDLGSGYDQIYNLQTREQFTGAGDFSNHISIYNNTVFTSDNNSGNYFDPIDIFTGKRH